MKIKIATFLEWHKMHEQTDPLTVGQRMSLNEYAIPVDRIHAQWMREGFTAESVSNGRWIVHLADAARRGITIPKTILADADPEMMAFDAFAFKDDLLPQLVKHFPKKWRPVIDRITTIEKRIAASYSARIT